mgnify:CR=1 FL=1
MLTKLHFLRQQKGKPAGQSHDALADFVAPKGSGRRDYIGAFAVTAGIGIEQHLERFAQAHDDYSSIMLKALADRFAEAFAERMHERVRREFWGYAPEERFTSDQLIREDYRGIRPAFGDKLKSVGLPIPSRMTTLTLLSIAFIGSRSRGACSCRLPCPTLRRHS